MADILFDPNHLVVIAYDHWTALGVGRREGLRLLAVMVDMVLLVTRGHVTATTSSAPVRLRLGASGGVSAFAFRRVDHAQPENMRHVGALVGNSSVNAAVVSESDRGRFLAYLGLRA